ncbi:ABC-2 type transport system ATP-binding protein [Breznakia sp. PF5-3]|uniref:ATP-binding cassette domain-containing protein n=1 Tax=unclassified Breznakia TaxID=2623764 RepID=UPI0024060413|nr:MULTISPECIES: ATP-binding cassette domain-containing protein [unclassified Breznakia]MDF9825787.1 ABC-2 type transport system ATP-binding protein [Breznakia sp. PM6-1]MDF9836592.1 ABC-2 type transport system ATP-binding protein [Breznakia sp. PF5-3]MDF9838832.1 ABC-2 type transport system ATP-binding protein [Breznakia sp. PFB2-8]MDF9860855.1 ABC-2 type transport system ATP-binding protein [Breznakia sp. PH5-24]
MTESNIAISVSNLKMAYKDNKVLTDVNFTVEKGSTFALLGSNGAGKTTIIKILSTLLKADEGEVIVNNFNVTNNSKEVRNAISLTGQSVALDYILTGRENLQMIAKLRNVNHIDIIVNALLKQFDLEDAADKRIATYSGGMCRRLDLAMSLIGNPSIIFLDEPTTGLDPQARIALWDVIKNLTTSGITVLLTTQYLEEADVLADQIAILHKGKIVTQGSAKELKQQLPNAHLKLSFADKENLSAAISLLSKTYDVITNKESLSLSISSKGGVEDISKLLNTICEAKINVVEFSQKLPTLEDVFLDIVNTEEKKVV